jgi:hypothetical protein
MGKLFDMPASMSRKCDAEWMLSGQVGGSWPRSPKAKFGIEAGSNGCTFVISSSLPESSWSRPLRRPLPMMTGRISL